MKLHDDDTRGLLWPSVVKAQLLLDVLCRRHSKQR